MQVGSLEDEIRRLQRRNELLSAEASRVEPLELQLADCNKQLAAKAVSHDQQLSRQSDELVALQHELAADLEATRAALDAKEKELSDSKAGHEKEIKMLKNKACSRFVWPLCGRYVAFYVAFCVRIGEGEASCRARGRPWHRWRQGAC